MKIVSMIKKGAVIVGAAVVTSVSVFAQTTPPDTVTAVETNIDKVGTLGGKAYLIAAGLALAGVAVSFIRKSRR